MPLLKMKLHLSKLRQILALFLIPICLVFGLAIADNNSDALATPLTPIAQLTPAHPQSEKSVDLDKGSEQAKKASEKAFEGLETTKELIGKTEKRKQAIEHGRKKASRKLDSMAEKAEKAKKSEESLNHTEKLTLDRITDGK
ncbi:hypothetical protein [Coleofasciculus sp. E2-BRE-01]|uniref:hypothetical protein n=1 Tax=Coleofasciculus sp. E2-BRE-01 TaxID=3069524 RepID=UPI0032FD2563